MKNQIIHEKNPGKKEITIPSTPTKELAEFIGVLAGDGYIRYDEKKSDYIIEIVGDLVKDNDYLLNYVSNLIKTLFNVSPKVYLRKSQNLIVLRINSKTIYNNILSLGFPTGRKNSFSVPKFITEEYMPYFVRGLADNDFSLALKKRNSKLYPVITTKLKNKLVVEQVYAWLISQGFSVYYDKGTVKKDGRGYNDSIAYGIDINGENNLNRWMELIGFRNQRHLSKYERIKSGTTGI